MPTLHSPPLGPLSMPPAPRPRRFPRWLTVYLAPALLVVVACVQLTLVRTHDLLPWKGGGFGMFSTLDRPGARLLRVWLITPEGEALVASPPEYDVQKLRLIHMPNTALLDDVARQTARYEWLVYTYDQLAAMNDLSKEMRRQILRNAARQRVASEADSSAPPLPVYPAAVAFPASQQWMKPGGVAAEVTGVRVEVWRVLYDPDRRESRAEVVAETAVAIP